MGSYEKKGTIGGAIVGAITGAPLGPAGMVMGAASNAAVGNLQGNIKDKIAKKVVDNEDSYIRLYGNENKLLKQKHLEEIKKASLQLKIHALASNFLPPYQAIGSAVSYPLKNAPKLGSQMKNKLGKILGGLGRFGEGSMIQEYQDYYNISLSERI